MRGEEIERKSEIVCGDLKERDKWERRDREKMMNSDRYIGFHAIIPLVNLTETNGSNLFEMF